MKGTKICWLLVLIMIIVFNCTGCQDDSAVPTSATPKTNTEENINKQSMMNLEKFLYAEESEIVKAFGKPKSIDETECGSTYNYENFSFSTDGFLNSGAHVANICVYGPGAKMFGCEVGVMTPKEIRLEWGEPAREKNTNEGFQMEYRNDDNTSSVLFVCTDFRSPITAIWLNDLMSGVEIPMDLTAKDMEKLIIGYWIEDKYLNETDLKDFDIQISPSKAYMGLMDYVYEITDPNILTFKVRNSITTDYDDNNWFLEFYENGDRMEMYKTDAIGDKNPNFYHIYYRYK